MIDITKISSERRNQDTINIDSLPTIDILRTINKEDKKVPLSVEKTLPVIALLVDKIVESFEDGGRLIYVGAGTSGRLGILDASEIPPTFGADPNMIIAIIAGGKEAMVKAIEGAEDSKELAKEDLMKLNLCSKDVVIGIAASGRTPYVIGAIECANKVGATTACITTSVNSLISEISTYKIEAITGPEPIAGSTRMKSGTAQKMILNMISTTAMIKLGKVYTNLMIDVQQNNEKLVSRAIHIVSEATGITNLEAREYLNKYKTVKIAIFSIVTGEKDIKEISKCLDFAKGHLRKAIAFHNEKA